VDSKTVDGSLFRGLPGDLISSIRTGLDGTFYETLIPESEKERISLLTPEERGEHRSGIKDRYYEVVYGRNNKSLYVRDSVRDLFRKNHPTFADVLAKLKRKDYRHSSHLLQNFEASLMIGRVCDRIRRERPETLVWTRHDSIITTSDAEPYVRSVMLDAFAALGIVPTLKTKTLNGGRGGRTRPPRPEPAIAGSGSDT
jgi:hypothetical protein